MAEKRLPPPLPPRVPSTAPNLPSADSHVSGPPPPYESIFTSSVDHGHSTLAANDPRSSSTQSLVPSRLDHDQAGRRRLLLVYIHGFMGDETSFQSFPAHVHNLVAALVAESHVVHTKIYPRYRSRKNIEFARDDFSRWIAPHESATTDVVLLGHSMGGLVSAEVALAQVAPRRQLRHRIVGTINFDVPFLGMHPSVIKSGLASIFSPGAESPKLQPETRPDGAYLTPPGLASPPSGHASTAGGYDSKPPALPPRRIDTLFNPDHVDPNYNPAYENDVLLPMRKGWQNAWHFISKHNQDLIDATKQLVKSHAEFGGAMADYKGLRNRYCRIRALAERDFAVRRSVLGPSVDPPRVRFVNYYTSSTGRPKKRRASSASPNMHAAKSTESVVMGTDQSSLLSPQISTADSALRPESVPNSPVERAHSDVQSPELKIEHYDKNDDDDDDDASSYHLEEANVVLAQSMDHLDPEPISDQGENSSDGESWADAVEDLKLSDAEHAQDNEAEPAALPKQPASSPPPVPSMSNDSTLSLSTSASLATSASLPPLPDPPTRPPEPDYSVYVDKETRKLAEKDYSRTLKTYERAKHDHDRALRDRAKLEEKRQRQVLKEGKRASKHSEKDSRRQEKEREKEARRKDKTQENAFEKSFALQRRETEREWKETLDMKWNHDDGTVSPMPSKSTPADSRPSMPAPSLATTTSFATTQSSSSLRTTLDADGKPEKPRKERTFCTLPPKDASGNRDPVWVKVFMPDVDQVGAHCGLFFETSPAYEQLVGDVGDQISDWISETVSERIAAELGGE